jgi:hypothetical protein
MQIFVLMTLAHLLGDYLLQTDWVYGEKRRSLLGGVWHALLLAVAYVVCLAPWLADTRLLVAVGSIVLLHYGQDWLKLRYLDDPRRNALPGYLGDQIVHLVTLGVASSLLPHYTELTRLPYAWTEYWFYEQVNFYLLLVLLSTVVWETTAYVLRRHRETDLTFRRDWLGAAMRAVLASAVYWGLLAAL